MASGVLCPCSTSCSSVSALLLLPQQDVPGFSYLFPDLDLESVNSPRIPSFFWWVWSMLLATRYHSSAFPFCKKYFVVLTLLSRNETWSTYTHSLKTEYHWKCSLKEKIRGNVNSSLSECFSTITLEDIIKWWNVCTSLWEAVLDISKTIWWNIIASLSLDRYIDNTSCSAISKVTFLSYWTTLDKIPGKERAKA